MASLFITGNGFDIAHGIPTKYNDFRSFLIKKYPTAYKLRNEVTFIEDLENIDYQEFSAEILLSAIDRITGEDWSNFEENLAYVNFNHKFPPQHYDEDEVTEEEDNELAAEYLVYVSGISSTYIECSKLWQKLFQLWIKNIQKNINNNIYSKKENLCNLFKENDPLFFSFNYTKTLQKLYGIKKVTHIHNQHGQKLIFGHGKERAQYSDTCHDLFGTSGLSSSFLDDMLSNLKKDTSFSLKNHEYFFQKLNRDIDHVYSYGFSYGKVDSVYIKEIIRRISPTATWFFTSFEASDKNALRIKKIKLRRYGFEGHFGTYDG